MNHWSRKQRGWTWDDHTEPKSDQKTVQPAGLHLCNYYTVIYSNKYIYLVFISIDGTELQKLSEFLSDKSYKGVFCHKQANPIEPHLWMLVKWLWTLPKDGGWLPGEPTQWVGGWKLQSYPRTPDERTAARGWVPLPTADDLMHCVRRLEVEFHYPLQMT